MFQAVEIPKIAHYDRVKHVVVSSVICRSIEVLTNNKNAFFAHVLSIFDKIAITVLNQGRRKAGYLLGRDSARSLVSQLYESKIHYIIYKTNIGP